MADYSPVLEICESLYGGKSKLESEMPRVMQGMIGSLTTTEDRFKKMRPTDGFEI